MQLEGRGCLQTANGMYEDSVDSAFRIWLLVGLAGDDEFPNWRQRFVSYFYNCTYILGVEEVLLFEASDPF